VKNLNFSSVTRLVAPALFAAVLSAGAGVAQAQDLAPPSVPTEASSGGGGGGASRKSLSLNVPGGGNSAGGGTAGLWMMMSPQLNLGINVGFALDTENDPGHDVLLAPALRYYFAQTSPVAPFYYGTALIRFVDVKDPNHNIQLGVAGGLGAEWFVTDVFSIAGWTGLGINIVRQGDGMGVGTLTSGISAQIYWD
jgi:hypothetical protein